MKIQTCPSYPSLSGWGYFIYHGKNRERLIKGYAGWSYAGWIAPSCFRCVLAVAAWNQIIVGAEAAGFAWNFQPHLPCLVAVTDDPQGCLWIWKSLWGCSRTKRQWRANNDVCSQWLRYCSCCSNLQHAVYTCSVWIYGLDRLMYRGAIGVSG